MENLSDITDINRLKALAYDQIVNIDKLQASLNALNNRITELELSDTNDEEKQKV